MGGGTRTAADGRKYADETVDDVRQSTGSAALRKRKENTVLGRSAQW